MNFEEVKQVLEDLKRARKRIKRIYAQIEEYAGLQSSLKSMSCSGCRGSALSSVESIILRLEREQIRLETALQEMFNLEDKISDALEYLLPGERDVIIGCYMDCKTHDDLAEDLGYTTKTIQRKKKDAIKKISKKI